uniref:centrosomal protein of 95 kDa-like isoform X3 n=1 Tax=Doryrhamphus excisus TaxID=161450 RepID=UPI0025AE84C3|nr:centrosomal protein of 95 kDa-like isoform X3 [Doryrhamphus excisus]
MGTPEEEKDWLDVANDLLSKCHIERKLTRLTDCDANVFISLYENILKETVPDYIASPSSQEDDVHNVQCVIDSLSLDYLQISLSHITGENVIRGDKESIKNLLDIFDGLLEYLNEEISEGSYNDEDDDSGTCNGGLGEDFPCETEEPTYSNAINYMDATTEGTSLSSDGGESAPQSSRHSGKSEQPGSASELIGLGVSARTFTDNPEAEQSAPLQTTDAVPATGPSEDQDPPSAVLLHSAIALHPPSQSDSPQAHSLGQAPTTAGVSATIQTQTSRAGNQFVDCNGVHSPAQSEKDSSIQERTDIGGETLEPTNGGPRRVLFHTQPDVLFLTLQDELPATTTSAPDTEEEEQEEDLSSPRGSVDHQHETNLRRLQENEEEEDIIEQRSQGRERSRKGAEKELHHISEKLAHRIEELDQMLKRLLGNSREPGALRDDDELSQHSDSITQPHGTLRAHIGTPERFLYTSPLRGRDSLQEQSEDEEAEALSSDSRPAGARWQSEPLRRRKHRKTVVNQAYEKELRRLECKKRAVVDKERHKAQEAEREYRDAILKDFSKVPTRSPSPVKSQQRLNTQATSGRLRIPKKTPPLIVRENELLPTLLEELPYLQMSPREVDRMWQQQRQQMERLQALSFSHRQRRSKLSKEVEEAQRKHDLLAGMVHRQQEHSRRLRDFKEHIQQQRATQNRLREQRQQVARARKYHQDYYVQHRARLMRARTKEERMFRQLFEEGLELQKARLREQREYASQQREQHDRQHLDHIQSMENYYKDQFSLLAEKLSQERQEIQTRKKAQEKVLLKMKRELRSRMEQEISELQKIIVQNDQDDYFEDLEVQRLRSRVRMASFQSRKNYLH